MISVGLGGAIRFQNLNHNRRSIKLQCSKNHITVFFFNSTRVSNELGAGRADEARLALMVMVCIALTEGTAVGISTILVRHIWGRLYSTEGEVIRYVAKMMPLLAVSDFLDGFQCVLSGPQPTNLFCSSALNPDFRQTPTYNNKDWINK